MRVAMLIQGYHPLVGGAEKQLGALAPLLQSAGIDIHIITRGHSGLASSEEISGVPVHRIPAPPPKAVASAFSTLWSLPLLARLRPDVIHAHELLSPATSAVLAKRLIGCPVVAKVLRGGVLGDLAKLRRKRFGMKRIEIYSKEIDAFVVISNEIDCELAAIGIPPERRAFIPNGVDTVSFAPLWSYNKKILREMLNLPDGPIVVFSGRLSAEKRVDQLIEMWPSIRENFPNAQLLILGTGEQEPALRSMARDGVIFTGIVEEVSSYLQCADIFVLPSSTEGLSNSLLEAMSCGLPSVATTVGGATDAIEHEVSGLLVPPDSPQNLKDALLRLLGDPLICEAMGVQARNTILRKYSLPLTASRLKLLYERLLTYSKTQKEARAAQYRFSLKRGHL